MAKTSRSRRRDERFTYSDYLGWPADERWEIIDGRAWAMSPSPSEPHQRTAGEMFGEFRQYLKGKPCRPYIAPFDVVLSEHDVVQPDILVVCDASKITPTHIAGAPDLVVEILSPSTGAKDRREKLDLYEHHGVREYLMVSLEERLIQQYGLGEDGHYERAKVFAAGETYRSAIFKGLEIDLARILGWGAPKGGVEGPSRRPRRKR